MFRLAFKSNDMDTLKIHKQWLRATLLKGEEVTSRKADRAIRSLTIRNRVSELRRKEGWPIQTRMERHIAESGAKSRHAVYFLPAEYLAGLHKE